MYVKNVGGRGLCKFTGEKKHSDMLGHIAFILSLLIIFQ